MTARTTISVSTPGASVIYDIHVGADLFDRCAAFIAALKPAVTSLIVIADENIREHLARVNVALARRVKALEHLTIFVPPGEAAKSLRRFEALHDHCLRRRSAPDRNALVLAVGGGVVGDLAGFFAATYLRGIRIVHLPTSLLAMVDSAVGGKTGVNHPGGKNLIGAFHQPAAVFADMAMLDTLPNREYVSALAEVLKYGVVLDAGLFRFIETHVDALLHRERRALARVIAACVRNKARIVARDERETGVRAVLNYGHTIGHAVEQATGFSRFLHGEAVAIGMNAAARIARARNVIGETTLRRQVALARALQLPGSIPPDVSDAALLAAMGRDKKRRGRTLRFVLPRRIGAYHFWECADPKGALAAAREGAP